MSGSSQKSADRAIKANDRFGERAVKLGFCDVEAVDKAVATQEQNKADGAEHQLIGIVMLEQGSLSNDQLIRIIKTYESDDAPVE